VEADHQLRHIARDIATTATASHVRCNGLLNESDLALSRQLEGTQMPSINSILSKSTGSDSEGKRVPAIVCSSAAGGDDLRSFQLAQGIVG
jgi:hypothetical protein